MTTTTLNPESHFAVSMPGTAQGHPFQFAQGIHISDASGIHEGYDLPEAKSNRWVFTINISAERIREAFTLLIKRVQNPGYLILEVGTSNDEEARHRQKPDDPHHIDVYYLDGVSSRRASSVFDEHAPLFIHDGRVQIGFGSHRGLDEVYISPYKIFHIFTDTPDKYVAALDRLRIQREKRLKTVWKTFTTRTPGRREPLRQSPAQIPILLASLQARGLYFAERREDVH